MVRAIEYTRENLDQIHEAYPDDVDRFKVEDIHRYENGKYFFVHDTNRMQINFVMSLEEVNLVYDVNPLHLTGRTTFFRIQ